MALGMRGAAADLPGVWRGQGRTATAGARASDVAGCRRHCARLRRAWHVTRPLDPRPGSSLAFRIGAACTVRAFGVESRRLGRIRPDDGRVARTRRAALLLAQLLDGFV